MTTRIVSFFALVFTALAMVPYGAHLFALPNKIGMTEAQYFIAQSVYQGWSLLAVVLIPAMLLNIAVAVLRWSERAGFALAVAACVCMIATLAIFFAFTYPANVATQNWTVSPPDWMQLRRQWEYSHAANAGLIFVSFCFLTLASLAPRR
jgi:hypothetical protein